MDAKGQAPSEDLKRAFANFKVWLTRIYENLLELRVEQVAPGAQPLLRITSFRDRHRKVRKIASEKTGATPAKAAFRFRLT